MGKVQGVGGVVTGKPEACDVLEHLVAAGNHNAGIVGHAPIRQCRHECLHCRLDDGAPQQPVVVFACERSVDLFPDLGDGCEVAADTVGREHLPWEITQADPLASAGGG